MRKLKLFLSMLMVMLLSVGNVWGATADVTYDFTGSGWTVSSGTLSNGTVSFTGAGGANFKMNSGYFMMGKSGAYLNFPTYSKAVEKIVVTGNSGASTSAKQNIYVGDNAVSTETTGATGTNTYNIDANYQAAGTTYTLKVTSSHNTQITKIEIFYVSENPGENPGDNPGGNEPGGDDPAPTGDSYELVTSVSDLAIDDKIIIVNVANSKALSTTQNTNNRGAASVTITNDAIVPGDDVQVLTLGQTNNHWTLYTGSGYLYAASSSSNNMKTQTTNNANGEWTIAIANTGSATLTAQGTYTRNLMRYNSQSAIFSCYASGQQDIAIFKKSDGTPQKEAAGLAFEKAAYLVKVNGSLATPTLSNPNSLSVSYASSDENVVAVNETTGALTIKAAGKAVITASSAETENFKAGSAKYTIYVAEQAGTAEDPLTVASTKTLIDLGCTTLNVYVAGKVSAISTAYNSQYGNISFDISADGATTGEQVRAYRCVATAQTSVENVDLLADVVVSGTLTKFGSTYELAEGCKLESYTAPETPKTDISNDIEHPYTVAVADGLIEDPNSDLSKTVFVKGVVTGFATNKVTIRDTKNGEEYIELYKHTLGENISELLEDEIVIVTGTMQKYNNTTYQMNQGCQVVWKKAKVSMTFDDLEMVVNDEEALAPKNITLATAEAVTYAIKEGSDDCITLANGVVTATAEGTATIVATVATVEAYIGTSVEFTVTVSADAPVLTDYYEKVTATENITDGTYLIVYENGNVAFDGGLETLDAVSNTIDVTIVGGNKIGVTEATAAATFFLDVDAGTIQSKSGNYIGVSSNSNGLKQTDDAATYTHTFSIDADGNAVIAAAFEGSTMTLRYNADSGQKRFRYYKTTSNPAIQLYKLHGEVVKANPELAWSGDVEITLGDDFTAPTLDNPHSVEGITFASDNTDLATITNAGVIELIENATGTAHITASFAGNDDYKAASVSCTIIVNASAPTPLPTAEAKVIVVEYNSKFYAMSTTVKNSNGFEPIEVTKENDKIIVKSDEEAAAIQWQIALGAEAATFQNGESKYLACSTESNTGLALLDDASEWAWDATASCYKQLGKDSKERTFYYNYNNGNPIFRAYTVSGLNGESYSGAPEFIDADKIEVQVPATKIDPELAFDPTEVELTLGETFTAPTLGHVDGFNGTITYSSSKPAVATVDESTGEVTIVANGTTTITASFEGNDDYEEDEASYTITVNKPAPTPTSTIYRKVTATADITDGEYLIVYEGDATHDAAVFDGSLDNDNIDVAKKVLAVEIENDEIAGNTELDAAVFTIDVTAGSLQSASGLYIGKTEFSNGMDKSTTEAYVNTFAITDGAAVITGVGNCTLRYNYASDQLRFRYYKSGQQAIQLYKKETVTPPTPTYTEVRNGLNAGEYYTMCLDKAVTAVQGGTIWRVLSKAQSSSDIILEEVEGTLDAGRPYIFFATAATLEVAYTGDAVGAPIPTGNNGLVGSFSQAHIDNVNTNYIIYNNELYYVNTDNVYVGAHRAYIDMTAVPDYSEPQQGNAPRRRVTMHTNAPQVATGIDALNASDKPVKMVINGQLFILRGEKMFDAKGQLVK